MEDLHGKARLVKTKFTIKLFSQNILEKNVMINFGINSFCITSYTVVWLLCDYTEFFKCNWTTNNILGILKRSRPHMAGYKLHVLSISIIYIYKAHRSFRHLFQYYWIIANDTVLNKNTTAVCQCLGYLHGLWQNESQRTIPQKCDCIWVVDTATD